ncbi:hypothetical protein SanaruYs_34740 [Chryseotalea sanaruensis]|uniref:Uncharacterized protein n=1 Tax=Chryseotalea sanaruensis TaxID=2482724 RepID=A0A401UE94_9BACT|nr:hypothetical protein SanaruYs_34740 [Chryseotalea sanaruensis]
MTVKKEILLELLRLELEIDSKFTDEMIELNLLWFFVQDDLAALKWASFIEKYYGILIPDCNVDLFFFSDLEYMNQQINKCLVSK